MIARVCNVEGLLTQIFCLWCRTKQGRLQKEFYLLVIGRICWLIVIHHEGFEPQIWAILHVFEISFANRSHQHSTRPPTRDKCSATLYAIFQVIVIMITTLDDWLAVNHLVKCRKSNFFSWSAKDSLVKRYSRDRLEQFFFKKNSMNTFWPCEMSTGDVVITWFQSQVHRLSCFEHTQARYEIQSTCKYRCADTWRMPTKCFCRWIVVCFICDHEFSYVYSHVCAKA
jgi:hypothetical protein